MTNQEKSALLDQLKHVRGALMELSCLFSSLGENDKRALYPSISGAREAINGLVYLQSKLEQHEVIEG